jgi:hypothetical protein
MLKNLNIYRLNYNEFEGSISFSSIEGGKIFFAVPTATMPNKVVENGIVRVPWFNHPGPYDFVKAIVQTALCTQLESPDKEIDLYICIDPEANKLAIFGHAGDEELQIVPNQTNASNV